jgi:hypothetical protein
MRRLLLPISMLLLSVAGCSSTLDSGYDPRPLTASAAQRKAYYASPYSEETQQALQEAGHYSGQTFHPGR